MSFQQVLAIKLLQKWYLATVYQLQLTMAALLCRTFSLFLIGLLAATSALPLLTTSRLPAHPLQTLESLPDTRQARQVGCKGESCNSTESVDSGNSTSEEDPASSQGCLSLKQKLAQDFGEVDNLQVHKSLFPFFVYPEIYLNLNDLKKDDTQSETAKQRHLDNCNSLQDDLNEMISVDSICSWSYTCEYNADEFPHYQIKATKCSVKDNLHEAIVGKVKCQQLLQDVHFAKKEKDRDCWQSADKPVEIGCQCVRVKEVTPGL